MLKIVSLTFLDCNSGARFFSAAETKKPSYTFVFVVGMVFVFVRAFVRSWVGGLVYGNCEYTGGCL